MKKILALTMAVAMSLSLAACGGGNGGASSSKDDASSGVSSSTPQGGSASSAQQPSGGSATFTTIEEGKLIMSTNAAFPPYEMVADGEGAYKGFDGIDVEIAAALADKLGLELVIDDMDFDSAQIAVQQGKSDMILAGLTYNEERDQVMDFSTSYATGVQVVIVADGSDIESPDDLEGKLIGTQRGTTGNMYCEDDYGVDNVLGYDNGALAVQALMNGQVDAVVIDNGPAQAYVAANAGLHILETEYVIEDYCLAVNEGNTALLNALNTEIEAMIADGTIQTIIDKYITE